MKQLPNLGVWIDSTKELKACRSVSASVYHFRDPVNMDPAYGVDRTSGL